MIEFNSRIWNIRDPDGILNIDREIFEISELKFLGDFHPREDFLSFENIESKIIIDFGFYGCEVKLEGSWQVYVVDGKIEEGWHSPLERHEFAFGEFMQGIDCIKSLLAKYT